MKRTGAMKSALFAVFFICTGIAVVHADKIITDSALGYSIYLPQDSWVRHVADSTHHQFYDSTGVYRSQISIIRHPRDPAVYPAPQDWTRANFIAYKLVVEYSVDPFGAMLYYDTASTVRQDSLWATESYATFFILDTTIGAWSEYTRFTANDRFGYELYAIGDTADMRKNIGIYAGLIQLIKLKKDASVRILRHPGAASDFRAPLHTAPSGYSRLFDPLGRRLRMAPAGSASFSAGVYLRNDGRTITRMAVHQK
jgi:hypothetical protein